MSVETTVAAEADVVVAGGGTAGCLAAVSAARQGASVILLERYGTLGGMITSGNAGLTMFMVFSGAEAQHVEDQRALGEHPDEVQIVGGITKAIADRIIQTGVGIGNSGQAGRYVFTSSEDLKHLLFRMMREAGVRLRLHSWVVDVLKDGDTLAGVVAESKSGRQAILGKQIVDATGDGDVAARAGVPFHVGVTSDDLCAKEGAKLGEMHPMGVMFRVGNVDLHRCFDWLLEHPDRFAKQPFARFSLEEARDRFKKGEMATFNILTDTVPGRFQVYNLPIEGAVTLCCPSTAGDGTEVEDLTRAEALLSDTVHRWLENIRHVPGFEKGALLDCPTIGVRETRHILGDYVLDIEDIFSQVDFPDSIGRGSHPIDTRPRPSWLDDPETSYPPRWFFHIPFRCLLAKGTGNLLVAGRCISATHEAAGCIRPTVQCMITGEAAGAAAALCVRRHQALRELPTDVLRAALEAQGVIA